ncbi:hypothetical protein [Methanogenium cariaci]|uniref:hypothetical protein n=1 Tax=Methanogenium cariaci TaxID=2197 RepID=UPI0007814535|nr:hypothetical protein [Methanogenium cariaci]
MVNWILNNRGGDVPFGETQAAIWMVLGQPIPPQYAEWDNMLSVAVAAEAAQHGDYIPDVMMSERSLLNHVCHAMRDRH